ncbi:hypothetical protein JCM1841_005005 [Sporobolomyces salmonicolor]
MKVAGIPQAASDICKIILAIVLPPLGVFLERGCAADFWINILLTILGYIPGIIHALYIILKVRTLRPAVSTDTLAVLRRSFFDETAQLAGPWAEPLSHDSY